MDGVDVATCSIDVDSEIFGLLCATSLCWFKSPAMRDPLSWWSFLDTSFALSLFEVA